MPIETKEINVTKEAVAAELAKLGINLPITAFKEVSATDCDGTQLIVVEIEQDMTTDEIRAFEAAARATSDQRTAESMAHFVVLELDGYVRRDDENVGKLHGVVSYITGEDAATFAGAMRFRRNNPGLSAVADMFAEAGIDLSDLFT